MFSIKEYEQCIENIHTVVDVINNTVRVYGNAMMNGERAVVIEARDFFSKLPKVFFCIVQNYILKINLH